MNWIVFAIFAYIALALETGLGTLLAIPGPTGPSPGFVLILAVFIGLMAPSIAAAWGMLILGALIDLQTGDLGYPLIGPAALAYLVGAFAALQLRAMVLRQSIITLLTPASSRPRNPPEIVAATYRDIVCCSSPSLPE